MRYVNLGTNADIIDFVEITDFDDKQKKLNKKVNSNKTNHLETEKKLTNLTTKILQISEKRYDFLLG